MTKQAHILTTKHRVWTVETQDLPDEFRMFVSWKGKWVAKEERQFNKWVGGFDLPFKTKNVRSTFSDNDVTITHHPNGMIVRERPGEPTEITFGTPP
jgi:hypothetical protein